MELLRAHKMELLCSQRQSSPEALASFIPWWHCHTRHRTPAPGHTQPGDLREAWEEDTAVTVPADMAKTGVPPADAHFPSFILGFLISAASLRTSAPGVTTF